MPGVEEHVDEVSLAGLLDVVWDYRRIILVGMGLTAAFFAGFILLLHVLVPVERIVSVAFRVEMADAARGEYPNGTKFSPNDIISVPVVSEVYKSNQLERYGTFEEFASGFFIETWSVKRDALAREYTAKLSDTRLNAVDRSRLEEEFQNKLKTLATPEYRLSYRRRERAFRMPLPLLNKVLEDTLATWARQADERKGALRYDRPVLSGKILDWSAVVGQDYLIGIDLLRSRVLRSVKNVDELLELPGASVIRGGPNQLTLPEVRVILTDLQRFQLEPASYFFQMRGASKHPESVKAYFDAQLQRARLARAEAAQRAVSLEESAQQYALIKTGVPAKSTSGAPTSDAPQRGGETVMPQFSESFLDRLLRISSDSREMEYRQKLTADLIEARFRAAELDAEAGYYESRSASLKTLRGGGAVGDAALEQRLRQMFDQLNWALTHVVALYEEISKHNLNPQTLLYTVTFPPTQQRATSLPLDRAMMAGSLLLLIAFAGLVAGSLGHHHLRQRVR